MSLIERVQSILLKPKETWPVIAAESTDAATIYSRYLVFLAAIPALAGFIGLTLIGVGAFGVSYRLPIATGLVQMVIGYLLSLAMVYVLALIVNALAPTFGGTKNQLAALKLVAYGSTAGFVGGIFSLLPSLALLGLLAAIYSIYLIYTGIAGLMRCPPEKAGAYTAVVIVCAVVAGIVLAAVSSLFVSRGPMGLAARPRRAGGRRGAGGGDVQIKTPDGATVTINPSAHGRHGQADGRGEQADGVGAEVGRHRRGRQGDGRHPRRRHRQRQRRADRLGRPEGDAAGIDRRHEAHRRSRRRAARRWASPARPRRRRTPPATAAPSSRSPTPAASPAWRRWPAGPT